MIQQTPGADKFKEQLRESLQQETINSHSKNIARHDHAYTCGDQNGMVYFIASGQIKRLMLSPDGKECILATRSPRAWAFALIGIHEYLKRYSGDSMANQAREELAERLLKLYQKTRIDEWRWYEGGLTYCNAVLPQALLMCGQWIPNAAMSEAGLESLSWLIELQRSEATGGHFVPIGSNGFYPRKGERARFDQQPVEAQVTISACLEAYRITGDKRWRKEAHRAFEWFIGRNDLNLSIYDPTTGGCRDGLHPDRLNENQGAESTLAFLQSLLEMRLASNGDCNAMSNPPLELFRRHKLNPILTAADWPYRINSVFNPAATLLPDGTTLLLCRVEDRRGHSHLSVARSANGVDNWQIDPQPTMMAEPDKYPEELWGIEDPRITFVPDLNKYAIVHTAFSHDEPGVALAFTEDFRSFERYGLILPPEDKDAALLPHRIGGNWAMIHRPVSAPRAHMRISYSPDLRHWGSHKLMMEARRGS